MSLVDNSSDFWDLSKDIHREVESILVKVGILCRVFSRGKGNISLNKKLSTINSDGNPKYFLGGRHIQDVVGVRVVVYFSDDIPIVHELISNKLRLRSEDSVIDAPRGSEFTVTRYNLIFDISDKLVSGNGSLFEGRPIDKTFELQIRSVLSEGWHEVEHDLRYKNQGFWDESPELSRSLDGILATLETSEWCMGKVFDDLAYKHYKLSSIIPMLVLRLRLRVTSDLDDRILDVMICDNKLIKSFLRMDRVRIIKAISRMRIPANLNNCVYIWNLLQVNDQRIIEATPPLIMEKFEELGSKNLI